MPPSSSAIGAPYMRPDLFQPQHAVLPQAQAPPSAEDLTLYTTLAAYADALDALPLDLTRSFSDLRELDAVLGAHLSSIAAKLQHLTAVIEDPSITPGERLLALKEVAEEARAYKMGGEDKIRVAVNTSETIISHTDYIDPLLDILGSLPALAPMLSPTKYLPRAARGDATGSGIGTSASSSTLAPNGADAGTTHATSGKKSKRAHAPGGASGGADRDKRKAGGDGVATASASAPATAGPTPSKKRKAPGAGPGAASGTTNKSARTAAANVAAAAAVEEEWAASRAAKNEKREGAPSGSTTASKSKRPAPGESRPSAASASARLPRAAHTSGAYIDQDEDDVQSGTSRAARPAGELVRDSRRTGGADDERSSRPARNARGGAAGRGTSAAADADEESSESGLGLSTTRGAGSSRTPRLAQVGSAAGAEPALAPGGGAQPGQAAAAGVEAAGGPGTPGAAAGEEADERRYCFCNNVSYGDMIGCDDDDCEREWFHLGCVGLLKPPQGTWYCEACLERRSRESRNKSKRPKASKGGDKPRLASGKR